MFELSNDGPAGPRRFVKIAWIWIAVAMISIFVAPIFGRHADLARFLVGAAALWGPFVLKTITELRFYGLFPSFVHSTFFFLFASYRYLSLTHDVLIWVGRVSIVVGFATSILGLWT